MKKSLVITILLFFSLFGCNKESEDKSSQIEGLEKEVKALSSENNRLKSEIRVLNVTLKSSKESQVELEIENTKLVKRLSELSTQQGGKRVFTKQGDYKLITCHLNARKLIKFKTDKDILEISVGRGPCYSATFTIVIKSVNGEIFYSYNTYLKTLTSMHWQEQDLDKEAKGIINRILSEGVIESKSLPDYSQAIKDSGGWHRDILIAESKYAELKLKTKNILKHPYHYEGWQYIYYDTSLEKSEKFMTEGL